MAAFSPNHALKCIRVAIMPAGVTSAASRPLWSMKVSHSLIKNAPCGRFVKLLCTETGPLAQHACPCHTSSCRKGHLSVQGISRIGFTSLEWVWTKPASSLKIVCIDWVPTLVAFICAVNQFEVMELEVMQHSAPLLEIHRWVKTAALD